MKPQKWAERAEAKPTRKVKLEDLLKRIPTPVFIRMAMKSGLTPMEQRALVDAHRNL